MKTSKKSISERLKAVYTATQCTDINDVKAALDACRIVYNDMGCMSSHLASRIKSLEAMGRKLDSSFVGFDWLQSSNTSARHYLLTEKLFNVIAVIKLDTDFDLSGFNTDLCINVQKALRKHFVTDSVDVETVYPRFECDNVDAALVATINGNSTYFYLSQIAVY